MTPKEKAKELVNNYLKILKLDYDKYYQYDFGHCRKCALIAVDEILDLHLGWSNCDENNWEIEKFYEEVKKEIENL